jgi:hypothetical protein
MASIPCVGWVPDALGVANATDLQTLGMVTLAPVDEISTAIIGPAGALDHSA